MIEKTLQNDNLDWNVFVDENRKTSKHQEIIECINQLEKEPTVSLIEKALTIIREKEINKEESSFLVILRKLQEETKKTNKEDLNWWDSFFINRGSDLKIKKIIEELEVAEKDAESESLNSAILLTSKLDNATYEGDINTLNKRIRMLQKRVSRRVSNNFGSIILSLREQRGLSLSKLGDMAGVSASYINRIELNERRAPSYPIIEKLAEALEVNINTLLVAAGAHSDTTEVKSLRELIFSNNISLTENGDSLPSKKKEELVRIIDFVSKMEWKDNKHIESLQLLELINKFKFREPV